MHQQVLSVVDRVSFLGPIAQSHLLKFWDNLETTDQTQLLSQLSAINWDKIDSWVDEYVTGTPDQCIPDLVQWIAILYYLVVQYLQIRQ